MTSQIKEDLVSLEYFEETEVDSYYLFEYFDDIFERDVMYEN